MGQFDQLKNEEEIVGAKVENTGDLSKENNNNQEVEPVVVPSAEEIKAKEDVKVQQKTEDNKKIEEIRSELMGKVESKEGYSEGHIMNPKMLDKIAQLEAISPDTLEFDQQRYDDYINSQAKFGSYTVGENQKKIQTKIDAGKKIRDYYGAQVIYGQGGWNRYPVNEDSGEVFLSRGSSNTTGSPEYKAKLAQKAIELGIKVEGQ